MSTIPFDGYVSAPEGATTPQMVYEMLDIIREGRRQGETAVPVIMRLGLPSMRTLAIMRELGGLDAEERIAARHARGEITCALRLEDVEAAREVLCRHLTPEMGPVLARALPPDGCWFVGFAGGAVSLLGASTEQGIAPYVPRQDFALAG